MKRYLAEHWRAWIAAAAVGIVAALTIACFLPGSWLNTLLVFDSWLVLGWTWVIILFVLIFIWPRTVAFWRRWLRTVRMRQPPISHLDLLLIFGAFFGITIWSFVYLGVIRLPTTSGPMRLFLMAVGILLGTWILSVFVWSWMAHAPHGSWPSGGFAADFTNRRERQGDFPDEPITEEGQDLLGRGMFVEKLYEQITRLPTPKSFVFGLYGGWGEGKTSVLNLLRRRLASNATVIPVVFNPWYLATEEAVIKSFYASIEHELERRYLLIGLHRVLSRYQELLTFGLHTIGFGGKLPTRDDPQRLRQDLESWVARTGCRLVILIDDVDRLQAPEALSVFKLVALSARLQDTVFLLSFDYHVIHTMLRDVARVDPDFLDKVIQKPLPLPPAEQRDIDRFLLFSDSTSTDAHRSAIDQLFDEIGIDPKGRREFDEKFVVFYQMHLRPLFRTLRRAKRFLNSLRATLPAVVGEVDLYDFVLLETLQVFFHEIYQDIWRNPWCYVPPWSPDPMFSSPFITADTNEKYRHIRKRIEGLLAHEPQANIAQAILEEVFCIEVKNAFSQGRFSNADGAAPTYRAAKRLTHPACFPKYFLFRVPTGEISDRSVEDLIHQWNQASEPETEHRVGEALRRYKDAGLLGALLNRLQIFIPQVAPIRVQAVIRGLYRNVPLMSHDHTPLGISEHQQVALLALHLIEERAASTTIASLIEEIIREGPSLPFAVLIVFLCNPERRGDYYRMHESLDLPALRRVVAQRLYAHYVEGRRDIFAELSADEWEFVLYQWGTNGMTQGGEYRSVVQDYVISLIDQKPNYFGNVLRRFINKGFRPEAPEEWSFSFIEFCHLYDPAVILNYLNCYGDEALATEAERRAAELFRQRYLECQHQGETMPRE